MKFMEVIGTPFKAGLVVLAFPVIVLGNTFLAVCIYRNTQNLFLASFTATLGFVSLTMLFEQLIPFRQDWDWIRMIQFSWGNGR